MVKFNQNAIEWRASTLGDQEGVVRVRDDLQW